MKVYVLLRDVGLEGKMVAAIYENEYDIKNDIEELGREYSIEMHEVIKWVIQYWLSVSPGVVKVRQ